MEARDLDPWLQTTQWHRHVAGHKDSNLPGLIVLPKPGEKYFRLQGIVLALFREADALLDSTPELGLCMLATSEPEKCVSCNSFLVVY